MGLNVQEKLGAARLKILNKMPYMYTAVLTMVPIERKGLGSFGVTEKGTFLYDPDYIEALPVEEVASALVKCATHLLRTHGPRRKNVGAALKEELQRWNLSTSMAVNVDLHEAAFRMPEGAVFPKDFSFQDGQLPEEYYQMFPEEPQGPGQGQDGPGQGGGRGGDQGAQGRSQGEEQEQKADGFGGMGGSGMGNPFENEPTDGMDTRTDDDLAQMRQATAEEIKKASQNQGDVPGGFLRWADEQLKPPKIAWQDVLARLIRGAVSRWSMGKVDLRFCGLSRRQAGIGFGPMKPIMPRFVQPLPSVAVAADTSGSMGPQELQNVMEETNGIIRAVGGDVDFLACDSAVHAVAQCRTIRDVVKNLKGGGGTSFVPVFEKISSMRQQPDLLVFITDGMGEAPSEPPPYDVIWVLVGPYQTEPATWGSVVRIEPESV